MNDASSLVNAAGNYQDEDVELIPVTLRDREGRSVVSYVGVPSVQRGRILKEKL